MTTTIETVEAKVEIVQADMFEQFIQRDGKTHGLIISEHIPWEVWSSYTVAKMEEGRRSLRDIAQCLILGERVFGENYAQVIDARRYNPKTLQNAIIVVKGIEKWHDELTLAHHDVVCSLKAPDQEKMLAQARDNDWTVAELRKAKNELFPPKKKKGKAKEPKPPQIDLTNEAEVLQAGHMMVAFLEKAEADMPFRQWPKARMDKWAPILRDILKIARWSVIKTH